MTGRLDGKVALITGAARGMGAAAARLFVAEGASVVLGDVLPDVKEVATELGEDRAIAVTLDVTDEAAWRDAVAAGEQRFGRIDVLVNNAGAAPPFGPLIDVPAKVFDKIMAVNVRAPLALTRAAVAAGLGSGGGSVINIVSAAGLKAEPFMGLYSAAKAAMISATRTLARELGPGGIRVNAVAPGVIRTDFSAAIVANEDLHASVVAKTALGRVGEASEVAGAVAYLASSAAAYTTGSILVVDGGTVA